MARTVLRAAVGLTALLAVLATLWSPMLASWWPAFGALLPLCALLLSVYAIGTLLIFGVPLLWAHRFDAEEARLAEDGEDRPGWAVLPARGTPRRTVLLIHGTFANDAEWVQSEGPLAAALRADANVLPFRWSGANSMKSRQRAVERLRRHIADLDAAGHTPVALVGHSHAGNIVMKACEDPATASRVRAIVCLNTPFISAWQPAVDAEVLPLARVALCVLALGQGMALWMLSSLFVDAFQGMTTRALAILVGSAAIAVPVAIGALHVAVRMRVDGHDMPAEVAASVCRPEAIAPLAGRTLILGRAGDEADGVLKLASMLNRQLLAAWRLPLASRRSGLLDMLFRATLHAGLMLLGSLTSLAFGTNGLRHPVGTCYTSSETPQGQWTHRVLAGGDAQGDLYHSSLYGDPHAIAEIRHWLDHHGAAPDPARRPAGSGAGGDARTAGAEASAAEPLSPAAGSASRAGSS